MYTHKQCIHTNNVYTQTMYTCLGPGTLNKKEVRAHKTRLIPPLFIKVSVQSQESKRSSICEFGELILSLSKILL